MHATAQPRRHPRRRFGPRPHAPVRWGLLKGRGERGALPCGEEPCSPRVMVTAVLKPRGPSLVVAPDNGAEPADRVARDRGHLRGGQALRQQPDDLPVTAHDGIFGLAIPDLQLVNSEMCLDRQSFWHAIIIHEDLV
jgi:hypothetical protein